MKNLYKLLTICLALTFACTSTMQSQVAYYVANDMAWNNWDIYSFNLADSVETRITFDLAIDNHPSISHYDTNMIVWSSTRNGDGEFNLFIADITEDVDAAATQITFNNDYPDRHPHWHPNGRFIVYTSKDREVYITKKIRAISECSVPLITARTFIRYYEGMNLIDLDEPGTVIKLDVEKDAWDGTSDIWIEGDSTYVGHPSFNHQGDMIVFTAAIDGQGKNWEVYTAGFDPVQKKLVPNTLRRVTLGPDGAGSGFNPIRMSGGATFSYDDSEIIFNSTRTYYGNSQIFSIPADTVDDVPALAQFQREFNMGNDYVAEALDNDRIIITSDLGQNPLCDYGTIEGPTNDLDVCKLSGWSDGATRDLQRTVLGTEDLQQQQMIPDEVSWFCGTKPNLSLCTFLPRIMPLEAIWLENNPDQLPDDLLVGYDPSYLGRTEEFYNLGSEFMEDYLAEINQSLLDSIMMDKIMLSETFPGWEDTIALDYWLESTKQLRKKKYVVPTFMEYVGIGITVSPGINESHTESYFGLQLISPNPFSRETTIKFELSVFGHVQLRIYDLFGKEVRILLDKHHSPGNYSIQFYAGDLPPGIYFCALSVNKRTQVKKIVLLE